MGKNESDEISEQECEGTMEEAFRQLEIKLNNSA